MRRPLGTSGRSTIPQNLTESDIAARVAADEFGSDYQTIRLSYLHLTEYQPSLRSLNLAPITTAPITIAAAAPAVTLHGPRWWLQTGTAAPGAHQKVDARSKSWCAAKPMWWSKKPPPPEVICCFVYCVNLSPLWSVKWSVICAILKTHGKLDATVTA